MARRFRRSRRHSGRRSSRKTRWLQSVFQGENITLECGFIGGGYEWVSFWLKWPASMQGQGVQAPQVAATNEPVDETLVRCILDYAIFVQQGSSGVSPPTDIVLGIIPFDGGEYPDFYDAATFQDGVSLVAPPHPIIQGDDDWIIRVPFNNVSLGTIFSSPGTDLFCQSRAMRKLPAGTGILAVFGALNFTHGSFTRRFDWSFDVRMALRSGFSI